MRMICTVVVLILGTATASMAQGLPGQAAIESVRLEDSAQATDRPEAPRRVTDKKFWILGGALNSAMLLDTKSTFDVGKVCVDCYEANPFVAPFVRRGPVPTYIAGELFDAGVMTIAARMRGAHRPWMRRTWWVIPVALITGHSIAYRHNVNLMK